MQLLTSNEVTRELRNADASGEPISNQAATTIASWYMSPSPRDAELCKLAHGLTVDMHELLREIRQCYYYLIPDTDLPYLLLWAKSHVNARN